MLEAVADHHLWFWHISFGYPGTLNDISILEMSPLFTRLTNGTFREIEEESAAVPFSIANHQFTKLFFLTDGIYQPLARFVKNMKHPITNKQTVYTSWQEGARKDIERAFGVLRGCFQHLQRPLLALKLNRIGEQVSTCLILHNMCISDRIMDNNPRAIYKPDVSAVEVETEENVEYPEDFARVQLSTTRYGEEELSVVGVNNMPEYARHAVVMRQWDELVDKKEHKRLMQALLEHVNTKRN